MNRRARLLQAAAVVAVVAGAAIASAQNASQFTDFTSAGSGVATGTASGVSVRMSGTHVSAPPASVIDGSSNVFAGSSYSPPLGPSDYIEIRGQNPASYTLTFGQAVTNPVLHIHSLASRLDFPSGTSITRLSGTSQFTVSGAAVSGTIQSGDDDGSVRIAGTFTSLSFTATPLFAANPAIDGIILQVGFVPPAPAPPPAASPTVTASPAPPAPTVTAAPTTTPEPPTPSAEPRAPVLGKTVNVEPLRGEVLVQRANGSFVPLTGADQIVSGTVVDARNGSIELTSAVKKGKKRKRKLRKGVFAKGVFSIRQYKKGRFKGLVELRLTRQIGGAPLSKGCGSERGPVSAKVLNRISSDASGDFRTRGRFSSARVRGAGKWDVADRCDGTLTKVRRGSIEVADLVKRKVVKLGPGESYLTSSG